MYTKLPLITYFVVVLCTATIVHRYSVVCVEFYLVKVSAFLAFWSARVGAPSPICLYTDV